MQIVPLKRDAPMQTSSKFELDSLLKEHKQVALANQDQIASPNWMTAIGLSPASGCLFPPCEKPHIFVSHPRTTSGRRLSLDELLMVNVSYNLRICI